MTTTDMIVNEAERLQARVRELEAALREAWPYVPDHHGPVQHRIKAALTPSEPRR